MAAAPNTRPAPQVVERLAGASGRPGHHGAYGAPPRQPRGAHGVMATFATPSRWLAKRS